jgi:hypothetical protein
MATISEHIHQILHSLPLLPFSLCRIRTLSKWPCSSPAMGHSPISSTVTLDGPRGQRLASMPAMASISLHCPLPAQGILCIWRIMGTQVCDGFGWNYLILCIEGIPGEWMFVLGADRIQRCKAGIKGDTCDEGGHETGRFLKFSFGHNSTRK